MKCLLCSKNLTAQSEVFCKDCVDGKTEHKKPITTLSSESYNRWYEYLTKLHLPPSLYFITKETFIAHWKVAIKKNLLDNSAVKNPLELLCLLDGFKALSLTEDNIYVTDEGLLSPSGISTIAHAEIPVPHDSEPKVVLQPGNPVPEESKGEGSIHEAPLPFDHIGSAAASNPDDLPFPGEAVPSSAVPANPEKFSGLSFYDQYSQLISNLYCQKRIDTNYCEYLNRWLLELIDAFNQYLPESNDYKKAMQSKENFLKVVEDPYSQEIEPRFFVTDNFSLFQNQHGEIFRGAKTGVASGTDNNCLIHSILTLLDGIGDVETAAKTIREKLRKEHLVGTEMLVNDPHIIYSILNFYSRDGISLDQTTVVATYCSVYEKDDNTRKFEEKLCGPNFDKTTIKDPIILVIWNKGANHYEPILDLNDQMMTVISQSYCVQQKSQNAGNGYLPYLFDEKPPLPQV